MGWRWCLSSSCGLALCCVVAAPSCLSKCCPGSANRLRSGSFEGYMCGRRGFGARDDCSKSPISHNQDVVFRHDGVAVSCQNTPIGLVGMVSIRR